MCIKKKHNRGQTNRGAAFIASRSCDIRSDHHHHHDYAVFGHLLILKCCRLFLLLLLCGKWYDRFTIYMWLYNVNCMWFMWREPISIWWFCCGVESTRFIRFMWDASCLCLRKQLYTSSLMDLYWIKNIYVMVKVTSYSPWLVYHQHKGGSSANISVKTNAFTQCV